MSEHMWMHSTSRILIVAEIHEAVAIHNGRGLCAFHLGKELDL
jgi:hypothetical protein